MKILIYLTPLFLAFNLFALDIDLEVDNAYEITLKNNSNFSAYFIHQTTKSIKFSNIDSTFSININDIKTIKEIEDEYTLVSIYPYIVNKYYWFKYKNGKKRRGKFIKIREPYLFLKSGQLDFKVKINDIEYLNEKKAILKKTSEQVVNYYFMRPSAYPVKKNALSISSFYTYGNFKYGLNDYFSIGGGLEPLTTILFLGLGITPFYSINADFYIPINNKNNISLGLFYSNYSNELKKNYEYKSTIIGIKYTYGSNTDNITTGLDFSNHLSNDFYPILYFIGILKLSDYFSLLSETNFIFYEKRSMNFYTVNGIQFKISDIYLKLGVQKLFATNRDNLNESYKFFRDNFLPFIGIQTKIDFNMK